MIKRVEIQNFKCFQNLTQFEFSKLNLLTGINGRGKSSLLQAILIVSQSFNGKEGINRLIINGEKISLGNYDDIRNSATPKSESINFSFTLEDSITANFKFIENERDEMSASLASETFEFGDQETLDKFNTHFNDFKGNIEEIVNADEPIEIKMRSIIIGVILSNIHYISADRLGPVKYVDKASVDDSRFLSLGPKGELLINILAKGNLPLVNDILYKGDDAKSVIQQVEEWLNYILEGAKIDIKGKEGSSSVLWMLMNNKSDSFRYKPTNIGFGYSYILPLIVAGLIAQPGSVLIVENPEAHLHPRAQSRIAEFFARVAANEVQVFIESHSEHILNGLRVSALNPAIPFSNSDLNIHFFDENFSAIKLSVDENGKVGNWPHGFFDQQEIDLADIFKYSR